MKKILKIFDYVFVLRPTLFYPVWTIFFAGFFVQNKFSHAATEVASNHAQASLESGGDFIWLALSLTLLMGAVFILNQIMDRHTDDKNKKLFLIARGHITPKAALVEATILMAAAFAMSFVFSLDVGVSRNMGLMLLLIFIVTGIGYSFKPFSWKDKPILGLGANILGAFLIFGGGWIIGSAPSDGLLMHAVPYVCAVASVYLYTTLPDLEGDAAAGKVTFAVKYGFRATVYGGFVLESLALVTAFLLQDEIIFYPAFFSMPFFIWVLVKMRMEDVLRAIKFPIMILALTVAIKFKVELNSSWFFFALVGVYVISKVYYKLRFDINYPNLSA